jgi:ATP-dependent Lhr-like helicase
VVVLAPTAGGKTEASIFPAISQLIEQLTEAVGVLYVAPLRALLNNKAASVVLYAEMVGLRRCVLQGDTPDADRLRFLREPTELLMTTPESLEVMLVSQRVDAIKLFTDLRLVIVDEVHALAGTDRGAHLMSILERIRKLSRHDLQRVGLSATVGNPEDILRWLQGTSQRPGVVIDPPKPASRRQLLIVHHPDLVLTAEDAAGSARGLKSLFFCQSRATAEAVATYMRHAGTTVYVHHSSVSREERQIAEEQFHHGSDVCIVCTSTLEPGIDVGDLDRVLQAEAPNTGGGRMSRRYLNRRRRPKVRPPPNHFQGPIVRPDGFQDFGLRYL